MHPIFLLLFFYLKPWDILCQICRLPHNSVHLSNTVAACCVDTKGKPNRLLRLFWCTLSSPLENKNSDLRQVWAEFWHEGSYFYQLVVQSTVKRASYMLCLSILYGNHVRKAASMQLKTWNTVLSNYWHIVGRGECCKAEIHSPPVMQSLIQFCERGSSVTTDTFWCAPTAFLSAHRPAYKCELNLL